MSTQPYAQAVQAVVDAAREWSAERFVKDLAEADLMKAIYTLDGDWPGCEECDHQCDEPCMPATVSQQHACVDRQIAQLVHEGKLLAHDGYAPPEGFQPFPPRRKTVPIASAIPHGVRCHNDACAGGQLQCPTPEACGVVAPHHPV